MRVTCRICGASFEMSERESKCPHNPVRGGGGGHGDPTLTPISDAMIGKLQPGCDAPFGIWKALWPGGQPVLRWAGNTRLSADDVAEIRKNKSECFVHANKYFA